MAKLNETNKALICKLMRLLEKKRSVGGITILFTDVSGSSKLWADDPEMMSEELENHHRLVSEIFEELALDGIIVKTVGDAFMLAFTGEWSLSDAVLFATTLLEREGKFRIRIGIARGEVVEMDMQIQGVTMKDYLGNTVNTASRMESKVSEEGGLAFADLEGISREESESIITMLREKGYEIERIRFSKDCKREDLLPRKRSGRLLTDLQVSYCRDSEDLKGVNECDAYKAYRYRGKVEA